MAKMQQAKTAFSWVKANVVDSSRIHGAFVVAIIWSVYDHYNGHFLHWCGLVKSSLGLMRFIGKPVKPD